VSSISEAWRGTRFGREKRSGYPDRLLTSFRPRTGDLSGGVTTHHPTSGGSPGHYSGKRLSFSIARTYSRNCFTVGRSSCRTPYTSSRFNLLYKSRHHCSQRYTTPTRLPSSTRPPQSAEPPTPGICPTRLGRAPGRNARGPARYPQAPGYASPPSF